MFYDRFVALCAQRGETPSRAALNAGISKAIVSKWKQNPAAFPSGPVAEKLANYFGITIPELIDESLDVTQCLPGSVPVSVNPNSPAAQGRTLAQSEEEEPEEKPEQNPETFYDRLARISRSYGMSPSRAALAAGVSKSAVSKWKREPDAVPSGTVLSKLAAYFGISASELLGESKPAAPEVSEEDIKFALFGGSEDITQEMYDEVRSFAAFVKEREANKRGKE